MYKYSSNWAIKWGKICFAVVLFRCNLFVMIITILENETLVSFVFVLTSQTVVAYVTRYILQCDYCTWARFSMSLQKRFIATYFQ